MPADDKDRGYLVPASRDERRGSSAGIGEFEIFAGNEDFKFSAAHFVAYDGFRERLHGHNYQVAVRMKGEVAHDGYVMDVEEVRRVTRRLCKELNERFLCPQRSNVINSKISDGQVLMKCQDGCLFSFPESDCALLPIMHSTAEELAHYLYNRLVHDFTPEYLRLRGVRTLEICVSEAPRQEAVYRQPIPSSLAGLLLDSPCARRPPRPCLEPGGGHG
ncbi:hypothetical protein JKP88DRAFT_205704 [Tribonema minus]|uniref:6-pyruvoyltetrahydropterin synthase n=1 Tax=Tribonema minus TaxID=303371 RepID=A0A835ZBF3_9STRA|nr:hypothetical protein JKP88DRAFT_205704 [Tribonema minus]